MFLRAFLLILVMLVGKVYAGLDYDDPNIGEVVNKKYGLPFPKDYNRWVLKEAFKGDHRLPTGLVYAIEKKGIYIDLWKAEMAIHDEKFELANKYLEQAKQKDAKNHMIYWLSAKNLMNEGLRQDEKATKIKGKIFNQGYKEALKCRTLSPETYNCEV